MVWLSLFRFFCYLRNNGTNLGQTCRHKRQAPHGHTCKFDAINKLFLGRNSPITGTTNFNACLSRFCIRTLAHGFSNNDVDCSTSQIRILSRNNAGSNDGRWSYWSAVWRPPCWIFWNENFIFCCCRCIVY